MLILPERLEELRATPDSEIDLICQIWMRTYGIGLKRSNPALGKLFLYGLTVVFWKGSPNAGTKTRYQATLGQKSLIFLSDVTIDA